MCCAFNFCVGGSFATVAPYYSYGPWGSIVDIPQEDYLRVIFRSMMASARAQDMLDSEGEDLDDVDADVDDLVVASEQEDFVGASSLPPTYDFGRSLTSPSVLEEYASKGWFSLDQVRCPGGETVPKPKPDEAVVFRDFYQCGFRLPCSTFLRLILKAFGIQLHHLTPNGICTLSKYVWACLSFKSKPDVDCFFNHYELQYQPKAVKVNGERRLAQFGSCTFIPKVRAKGKENLRISYAQKPRWPNTWIRHWFYATVPGLTVFRGGIDTVTYPLASKMSLLVAERRVQPKMTEGRKACEKAFELACRFSSGRDLVEEFLAADIWPLCFGSWKDCKFRKVALPLYGTDEPVYFPVFGLTRPKGKSSKRIVAEVEAKAREILGPMRKLEYLSRVAIGGNMPRLNRVFDELKVNYVHWVPPLELQVSSSKEAKAKAVDPDIAKMGAEAFEAMEVNGGKAEALKRKDSSEDVAPHKKAKFSKGESSKGKTILVQTAPELGLTDGSGGEVMVVDEDLGGCGVVSLPAAVVSACAGVGQVSVVASETVEDVEEAMSNLPRLFEDESEFNLLDVMAESKGEGNTGAPNFVAEGDIDGCMTGAKVSSLYTGLKVGDVEQNLSMLGTELFMGYLLFFIGVV
jgi:hypothetical protein